jgi:FkbM family methyltransferase
MPRYNTRFGFSICGDRGLDSSRESSHEIEAFVTELDACDVVVDVGANVGLFTLLAATRGKLCLSFEPHPLNIRLLCSNVSRNGYERVEIFPVALSAKSGVMQLFGGGQGASLVKGWGGIATNYQTYVPVHTLDEVVAARLVGKRLLIKMDVEGHEMAVLTGSTQLIRASPAPVWLIEHGLTENFSGSLNPNYVSLFELFFEVEYRAYSVEAHGREVTMNDVKNWVRNRRREFGGINFIFRK